MSQRAAGAFDVKVVPQKPDTQIARAANLSRLTIDKRFHGDLEGISKGEMLAMQTDTPGLGRLRGTRARHRFTQGQNGSFVLQHSATMTRGTPTSTITVVPDSGTGELRGLQGKMTITVAGDGGHSYEFESHARGVTAAGAGRARMRIAASMPW